MAVHLGQRARRLIVVLVCVALAALGLGLAGPAQAGSSTHHWKVWVGNQSKDMAVQGMRFLPGQVWINAGDTVTWVANAAEPHTVTFLPGVSGYLAQVVLVLSLLQSLDFHLLLPAILRQLFNACLESLP